MASFAKLGVGNIVEKVISIDDSIATTEQAGVDFINNLYNTRDVWKQTFQDESQRKNYAGLGYRYDSTRDAFIGTKPYNSWTLNEETCKYEPPIEKPDDGKIYDWNEENQTWDEINNE
tara:strand:- start:155 stop:508 length:354 start_codon:yes stop_codon:yes gene_type:complete